MLCPYLGGSTIGGSNIPSMSSQLKLAFLMEQLAQGKVVRDYK